MSQKITFHVFNCFGLLLRSVTLTFTVSVRDGVTSQWAPETRRRDRTLEPGRRCRGDVGVA